MAPHAALAACVGPSRNKENKNEKGEYIRGSLRAQVPSRATTPQATSVACVEPCVKYTKVVQKKLISYGANGYAAEIGQDPYDRPQRARPPGSALWPRPVHWPTCQSCGRLTRYRWLACGRCRWLLCLHCHRQWRHGLMLCACHSVGGDAPFLDETDAPQARPQEE